MKKEEKKPSVSARGSNRASWRKGSGTDRAGERKKIIPVEEVFSPQANKKTEGTSNHKAQELVSPPHLGLSFQNFSFQNASLEQSGDKEYKSKGFKKHKLGDDSPDLDVESPMPF